MAKQLAALLGGGLDLKALAEMLRRQGRGQDTILAHITPQEAALLKARGGAGTINPDTGLPEFEINYWQTPVDPMGYEPPNMPVETISRNTLVEGEYSTEPPGDTYYATPYAPMPNFAQSSEPYFMGEQVQPQFEPAMTRSFAPQFVTSEFRPSMNYGEGMTGAATETFDRGVQAQAPERSFEDMLKTGAKQVLGTREGLAGLGTLASIYQARQAGQQARRMQQELSQIGAPNRALGQEMIARGQRGELTPVQMQQLAALDARQKQQLAQRGLTSGTAQQQQQARMQEMQQRGAQDLIDQGIKIAGIGDQYQAAAIRAGYAADQATRDMLNTTLTNLYRTIYGNVATPETTSNTSQQRG